MATEDQKKMAEQMREAARRIEAGEGNKSGFYGERESCCRTLGDVAEPGWMFLGEVPAVRVFRDLYGNLPGYWYPHEERDDRVIALCLAADVIEGGGL